jgi:hypothetical protein
MISPVCACSRIVLSPPWQPSAIQELTREGLYAVTRYQPQTDKVMRMHAQTAMIENGFVHLPKEAACRIPARAGRLPQRQARRPSRFDRPNA